MNKRLREFRAALADVPAVTTHWTDVARDPNDPRAIAHRARTLNAAWRAPIPDRTQFILERVIGRRVLDVGCVAHDIDRMNSAGWLHRRIAKAASECVGVDILREGVAHMREMGFEAVVHDLSTGPGPLGHVPRFDVIVAGELIEHVSNLDMLFKAAQDLLTSQGELVITTPNPYAPQRVRAGQRGECWENTDHIMYAFPSGIAELCERNGLVLAEAATTVPKQRRMSTIRESARSAKRRLQGTSWSPAGIATQGTLRPIRLRGQGQVSRGSRRSTSWFTGETFIYVVRRRPEPADG